VSPVQKTFFVRRIFFILGFFFGAKISPASEIEIAAFVHTRRIRVSVHRTIMEDTGVYQQQHYESASTWASSDQYYQFHVVHFVSRDFDGGHFALLQPRNETTLATVRQRVD
jgi:hypothetical protein